MHEGNLRGTLFVVEDTKVGKGAETDSTKKFVHINLCNSKAATVVLLLVLEQLILR